MTGVAPLPPRRQLFLDERGTGLRVSWHARRGCVVLSLWRDDVCTGSFQLSVTEAARLARFLVAHLGELAVQATRRAP